MWWWWCGLYNLYNYDITMDELSVNPCDYILTALSSFVNRPTELISYEVWLAQWSATTLRSLTDKVNNTVISLHQQSVLKVNVFEAGKMDKCKDLWDSDMGLIVMAK